MRRISLNIGSREQIRDELTTYGRDRARTADNPKAIAFKEAIDALDDGADVVRVGSAVWCVGDDSTSDWEIAAAARHGDTVSAG